MINEREDQNLFCSFCGKSQKEVKKLVAGPSVFICEECIALCSDIVAEDAIATPAEPATDPALLKPYEIKAVLDQYVRPAVESDGGAINFHSYHDGVVKVLLQGSCSGCPSSTITLKQGIENLLTRMVPEVTEVLAEGV